MKTETYANATLPNGTEVTYSLMTDETPGSVGCEIYGLEVRMGEEVAAKPGLTSSRASIGLMLDKLARGRVTPTTVGDIIEDYYHK
ncbi:MAG: DUF6514 family protein [Oscillospiraceae bacterium]|jgi:hypothetical protein|nr:DUF6514 family protein [Oscillospiraceae bacterium]